MSELAATEEWEAFVRGAAYVRANPRFDAEERDRKLELARAVQALIGAAQQKQDLRRALDGLSSAICDPSWPYHLILPRYSELFEQRALDDEEWLREVLARFSDASQDSLRRFTDFAKAAEEAAWRPEMILVFGSLFNFALEPHELPIIRPGPFQQVEERLGYQLEPDASVTDRYEIDLDFSVLDDGKEQKLNRVDNDWEQVRLLLPASRSARRTS